MGEAKRTRVNIGTLSLDLHENRRVRTRRPHESIAVSVSTGTEAVAISVGAKLKGGETNGRFVSSGSAAKGGKK